MKLIVGLGNPGDKYAKNRHNVGFMAVEQIHDHHDFSPWRKRFSGDVAEGRIGREKCLLLKPYTYMNESGRAVGEALRFYKIDLDDVIVLYDEIDLVAGKLKAKKGGGNAGHNGLRSMSSHVGNEYHRIRIGVGRPAQKSQVSSHVLRDFSKSDQQWLEPLLDAIARKFTNYIEDGAPRFLNEVASRLAPDEPKKTSKGQQKPGREQKGSSGKSQSESQSPGVGNNTGGGEARPAPGGSNKNKQQSAEAGPLADMLKIWKKSNKDEE